MDGIAGGVQTGLVDVGGELADAGTKTNERKRRANPRHQRSLGSLAIALFRKLVGNVGDDRLVAHRAVAVPTIQRTKVLWFFLSRKNNPSRDDGCLCATLRSGYADSAYVVIASRTHRSPHV